MEKFKQYLHENGFDWREGITLTTSHGYDIVGWKFFLSKTCVKPHEWKELGITSVTGCHFVAYPESDSYTITVGIV